MAQESNKDFRNCQETKKGETCICENGFCLTRPEVDKINTLILDYPRTKKALEECVNKPPTKVETGFDPLVVVIVGIVAVGAAFTAGYFVGDLN